MQKIAYFSFFSLVLFFLFISPPPAIASSLNINEENRGYWQIHTPQPTKEQLILLYAVENTDRLIVDDSAVNYEEIGEYPIVFSTEDGIKKIVKMTIQKESPIEITENPLIQLEYGANERFTLEDIQQLLGFDELDGFKFKILEGQVNQKEIGRYPLMLEIMDSYGRKLEQQIMVDILDLQAPIIQMAKRSLNYQVGEDITKAQILRDAQIVVTDDYSEEENIIIQWFIDALDKKQAGNYKIGVQATDENNNQSAMEYLIVKISSNYDYKNQLQYEVFEKPTKEQVLADIGKSSIRKVDMDKINYSHIGTYQMPIEFLDGVKAAINVSIVDTTAPIMTVNAEMLEYQSTEKLTEQRILTDLEVQVEDNYTKQLAIEFSKTMDQLQTAGKHQLILTARDSSGNKAQQNVQLKIVEGNTAIGTIENPPPMEDLTWIEGEAGTVEEEKSNFRVKTFSPTVEKVNDQIYVLQPEKKIAANLVPPTSPQKTNNMWSYFLLIIFVILLLSILSLNPVKKRKKRKVAATTTNRRYRRN